MDSLVRSFAWVGHHQPKPPTTPTRCDVLPTYLLDAADTCAILYVSTGRVEGCSVGIVGLVYRPLGSFLTVTDHGCPSEVRRRVGAGVASGP